MTEQTFAGVANILSAMPSSQTWTAAISTVYAMALKDWDDKLAQKVAMHALMNLKWRPSPAEMRELALQIRKIKVPNQTMHEQVRTIVVYHPPAERKKATDKLVKEGKICPLIPEVVERLGGWNRVGQMTEEQLATGIEKESSECLSSEVTENILALPMPERRQAKMISN
jgi:hypothetical protein